MGQLNESERNSRLGFCFVLGAPGTGGVIQRLGNLAKTGPVLGAQAELPKLAVAILQEREEAAVVLGGLFGKLAPAVTATTTAF